MPNASTATALRVTASLLTDHGMHTGNQFVAADGSMDICAAAYRAVTGHLPICFRDDECLALTFIETCDPALDVIAAISHSLDTEPPTDPGATEPNLVDHVSNWAATTPVFGTRPPTASEVIGRLLRTAHQHDPHRLAA